MKRFRTNWWHFLSQYNGQRICQCAMAIGICKLCLCNMDLVKSHLLPKAAAVSHYTFTYDAELQGKHRARTVICSDTWLNDSGTWKTASTHCSLVKGQ